ncbi:hypothetical protein [Paraflavitalea sp. CAU 1676]|uniref:hypothetical protein n=1 Tax=Paraflavitalea sp. CAU 1676 TaxID=3032598 RepID=UPI0023DC07C6|nr:hypothetical protein [Paraflavitalea sp. CAU 1676]MDF2192365.1 hypothetical protein [Paraflavitalea sp. CAU 1676]
MPHNYPKTLFLFAIIWLASSSGAFAQQYGYDRLRREISRQDIDSAIIFRLSWVGYESAYKNGTWYLFSKKNGIYQIQRFDERMTYVPKVLFADNPVSYFFSQKEVIEKDRLITGTINVFKKGSSRPQLQEIDWPLVDHYSYYELAWPSADTIANHRIPTYSIEKLKWDGKKNEYYKRNISTKRYMLLKRVIDLVAKHEFEWVPFVSAVPEITYDWF